MGRHYEVRWHAGNQEWRSDCGDLYIDKKGRQRHKTVAFRYPDGTKIPRSDKPAAMAALAVRVEALKPRSAGGFTLNQIAELFLYRLEQKVAADEASRKTYEVYSGLLSIAAETFGAATPAEQVRATDLQAMVDEWKDRGRKPTSINHLITVVSSCFSWASRPIAKRGQDSAGNPLPEQLIPANPFVKFPRLPLPQSPPKYADRKEIARFLRWLWNYNQPWRGKGPFTLGDSTGLRHGPPRRDDPRDHWGRANVLLIRFICWTGCRPSEACRARWEWLDWEAGEAGVITLPPKRWKNGRKTGKSRRIYLTHTLRRALRRIHDGPLRHPEFIFAHRPQIYTVGEETRGVPWDPDSLSKRIWELRAKAVKDGVPLKTEGDNRFHLYRLRHTRASDGLMRGLDAATVGEVLGTSADQITRTYGHLLDEHTASAAMRMAGRKRSTPPEA